MNISFLLFRFQLFISLFAYYSLFIFFFCISVSLEPIAHFIVSLKNAHFPRCHCMTDKARQINVNLIQKNLSHLGNLYIFNEILSHINCSFSIPMKKKTYCFVIAFKLVRLISFSSWFSQVFNYYILSNDIAKIF